ncbi:MAG: dTDP-glucose 4,6-dehydratase, partial [Hyphomicrobiales bacterium]
VHGGRVGETYNIGGGEELPNMAVIDAICAAVDQAFQTNPSLSVRFPDAPAARGVPSMSLKTFVTDRPGHDRRYAIDERKIREELGYKPAKTFESGFAETLSWFLENEAWWRGVQDGSYREWIARQYSDTGAA